ncbi:MAG: hypothetical protein BAJALOKI1v1_150015 [Promethearchaeota archaeon]|nr:MAG: hypothetical protein BAJALOKI1v1_150015 [Candidatus Lokiarchaeota archaeon]
MDIGDISYNERSIRANKLIDRVRNHNIREKLQESNQELKIIVLNINWVDEMFDERAIESHLWAHFRGYYINVINYLDIDELLINFDSITEKKIEDLTKEIIGMINKGVQWQYNRFKTMSPKELEEVYENMKRWDQIDHR